VRDAAQLLARERITEMSDHNHTLWRDLREQVMNRPGAGAAYGAAKARFEREEQQQEGEPEGT
jgi:hypothetical protein